MPRLSHYQRPCQKEAKPIVYLLPSPQSRIFIESKGFVEDAATCSFQLQSDGLKAMFRSFRLVECPMEQVHKAFELLSKSGEVDVPDVRYEVKVKRSDRGTTARGIYLREPLDAVQPTSHIADVSPKLREVSTACNFTGHRVSHISDGSAATCGVQFACYVGPAKEAYHRLRLAETLDASSSKICGLCLLIIDIHLTNSHARLLHQQCCRWQKCLSAVANPSGHDLYIAGC